MRENSGDHFLKPELASGLERLCKVDRDEIRVAKPEAGVERIDARFQGNGFSPHRHDTYAIGLTMSGVQRFKYRGEERASLPGQVIVIHPDELHDGGAGTEIGLRYRMIYVQPESVAAALGSSQLPYISAPVLSAPAFQQCLCEVLSDFDEEMGQMKLNDFLAGLAQCLGFFSDANEKHRVGTLDWPALRQCADYLKENSTYQVQVSELEKLTGLDRFSLSRQFRKAFGTSPHRYLVMRRLEKVKLMLGRRMTLADTAVSCGFSDQSHMTRHFKRAFGVSPGRWARLSAVSQG